MSSYIPPPVPPPYQAMPPITRSSTMALVSLIAGIAGVTVLPFLGSIVAIITGHMAKKEIRDSAGRLTGVEMANAGLVLGYVHLALSVIGVCIVVMIFAALFAIAIGSAEWSSTYIRIVP